MRKTSKRISFMLVLALSLVMLSSAFFYMGNAVELAQSEVKFVQSESEDRNFTPTEFTSLQLVVGKQEEFASQVEEIVAADHERYNSDKAAFDAEEAAKVEADPEYVAEVYPEYVDPVVNDYSSLFSTEGTYKYAEVIGSTPSTEVIDGVQKTTITVNYKNVNVIEPSNMEKITALNITVKAPVVGTTVTKTMQHNDEYNYDYPVYSPEPTITLAGGSNFKVSGTYYITSYPSANPEGYDEPFLGTFEEGKEYYVEVYCTPNEGYQFAEGATLTLNGALGYELSEWNFENQFMFYAKVKATTGEVTPTNNLPADEAVGKVLNGYNQTVNPEVGDVLSFRFDIPFAEFLANGKVYMDGQLVDSSKYTAKEGSTIITFNSDYAKTISVGGHSVKLAAGGEEITANFTIASTPSTGNDGGAVAGVAAGAAAGTTASSNPKTGDNIMVFATLFVVAMAGSVIAVKKYRK